MDNRPIMNLDNLESGVMRLKSVLYAVNLILIGSENVDGEDLDALKELVDILEECVRGIEVRMSLEDLRKS